MTLFLSHKRLGLLFATFLLGMLTLAQGTDRTLIPGEPTAGTIDATNPAQVYLFAGNPGDTVTLTLNSDATLALILTDSDGESLGQTSGATETVLDAVTLGTAGQYYATVFPAVGSQPTFPVEFTLTLNLAGEVTEAPEATDDVLDAEITEEAPLTVPVPATPESSDGAVTFNPGQQIALPQGLTVDLRWDTVDDLNLQVRDPVGETLFWGSRSTSNSGSFGPDRNGLCENLIDPPSEQTIETAEWPGGGVFVGSYEILVYHREACQGNTDPVDFTVDVDVNGSPLETIEGTILPPTDGNATVYLSSFTVDSQGEGSVGPAGPYTNTRELPITTQEVLDTPAEPVQIGTPIQGRIAGDEYYQTYTFEAFAGQIVNVNLTAISGNLDTLLLVLNSNGAIIDGNDDIVSAENTNSAINSLILTEDGVYTIMATRYGKDVGGTEGDFELLVSGDNVPETLTNLELPTGNIQVYLQWDTNADLQLLVRDPFGDTVFNDNLTVRSGGRLEQTGNINCTTPEEDPETGITPPPLYYIYWPESTFLNPGAYEVEVQYRSECGDTRPVNFSLDIVVDGQLIFTENSPIDFTERYLTSFSIDPATGVVSPSDGGILGGSDTLPWQGDLASAVAVAPGDTRVGSITPDDKFDLYTFEGEAGEVVTVSMSQTSGTLDTLLFLMDPNGIELVQNDDSNDSTNSLINVTLPQDGTYTIIATHFGAQFGGTIGGYNLSFSSIPPPEEDTTDEEDTAGDA